MGYGLKNNFSGYPHQSAEAAAQSLSGALLAKSIKIGYARPFDVEWRYDDQGAVYGRWRGGTKEMDKNNGQQVSAKNIVVMKTVARELEGQYNDVDVEGDGQAYFFLSGKMVEGKWQKKKGDFKSKLYFFDMSGKEIEFIPGAIWVEIVPLEHQVSWH